MVIILHHTCRTSPNKTAQDPFIMACSIQKAATAFSGCTPALTGSTSTFPNVVVVAILVAWPVLSETIGAALHEVECRRTSPWYMIRVKVSHSPTTTTTTTCGPYRCRSCCAWVSLPGMKDYRCMTTCSSIYLDILTALPRLPSGVPYIYNIYYAIRST